MRRKMVAAMLAFLMPVLTLCGCGCEHDWRDATCTEPKTCSKCEKTEGEALGHTWKDADCEHPKICTECGLTEGEALGHTEGDWETEADLVAGAEISKKYCTVCNAVVDEKASPLQLHDGEKFLFTPNQFASRIGKVLSDLYGDYKSVEVTSSNGLFMCDIVTSNGLLSFPNYFYFHDGEDNVVADTRGDEECIYAVTGSLFEIESPYLIRAFIMTCDPSLDSEDADYIAARAIRDQGKFVEENGIEYIATTKNEFRLFGARIA